MLSAPPEFRPDDTIRSWGRIVRPRHRLARPVFRDQLSSLATTLRAEDPGLAVGLLRSYGDSNLNPDGRLIAMGGLDRILEFNRETGLFRAEAGLSLSQCLRVLVPARWFLPTTPGSRFVTLGGAVANDVHGKNHHSAGSFGNSVIRIALRRTDGALMELKPDNPLFTATIGGLGLTGIIEWVEFQAKPITSSSLDAQDLPFSNVSDYFELAADHHARFEHTMAWIDCLSSGASLGRGIFSGANWSKQGPLSVHDEAPRYAMPIEAPAGVLNPLTVRAYNQLRYSLKSTNRRPYQAHYGSFLYPLDGIAHWNRLYGRAGFFQYQCVIPAPSAKPATIDLLKRIVRSGEASFLAVLKDFGPIAPRGLLSFPTEGTTLALDFPNRGERTLRLLADLDAIVLSAGGRLYPAKDGRISAEMFQAGFPNWSRFKDLVDPGLSSALWRRVSVPSLPESTP